MATLLSTYISNRDSVPDVLTDPAISGGAPREAMGYALVPVSSATGTLLVLANVPSNARMVALNLYCDALGTGVTGSVGVYKNYKDAGNAYGTVANTGSGNIFASGLSMASAISPPSNIINQAGTFDANLQEQPLWQAIGLSADPQTTFDIALTTAGAATASTGTQYVSLRATFIV